MNSSKSSNGLHQIFSPVTKTYLFKLRPALLALVVAMTALSAQAIVVANSNDKHERKAAEFGGIEVTNFGKVTDDYYRGAQPKENEYAELARLGIKTIIDLRDDPKDYARSMTEHAGMQYVNLPMSDKTYPAAESVEKFLSLVNDKNNLPVYVHCAGGRHRTGAMTAVFRMKMQGWDIERAYDEMKDYDFYTRWGHKDMKKFVFDYYQELLLSRNEEKKNSLSAVAGGSSLNR
ncbi:MAG: tyrosine-protein phosphatase [Acidobacteria bacterium]|nr:tyrosine-protein phosphatase [Acidobacteriota bacterium]